jgi:uncharacterized membrane protein YtjA (UPF0391 family)
LDASRAGSGSGAGGAARDVGCTTLPAGVSSNPLLPHRRPRLHTRRAVAFRLLPSGYAKEAAMLSWALTFFVIALIAALLGFGNVAGLSAEFGWIFVVIAVIFLIVGLLSGRRGPTVP